MPPDKLDVGELGAGPDEQREFDRDDHLRLDQQLRAGHQLVQSRVDTAVHRVLDRDHRALRRA